MDEPMKTYFPKAKHSNVILEASMAVVSGNFTLMSAGYFLSPEAKKRNKYPDVTDEKQNMVFFKMFLCRGFSFSSNLHQVVRG